MTKLQIGDSFIDFTLPATDGQNYRASEVLSTAQALVVVFTCNHCPYVLAWEERLMQIAHDYAAQGVSMLAINANDVVKYPDDSFENMKKRAEQKHYMFSYLWDESQEVAHAYGAERTPELFIFDAAGKLRYHGALDDNYMDEQAVKHHYARKALDAILAGQEVAIAETRAVGCTVKYRL
jgi:peroxiredoxin